MEEFRVNVKRRIFLFMCVVVFSLAIGIYDVFWNQSAGSPGAGFTEGVLGGLNSGLIFSLGAIALIQVIRLGRIIKDEKQLKMLYNKEHDERLKEIRSKAGMPMILIMSTLMLAAGIIAGFFSEIVFYTLLAASVTQLTIAAAVKVYCLKKM